jgi:hypothetical protein
MHGEGIGRNRIAFQTGVSAASVTNILRHNTDHGSQSELELIVPKSGYGNLRAMDKSENLIYVSFSSRTFLRARLDIFDRPSDGNV